MQKADQIGLDQRRSSYRLIGSYVEMARELSSMISSAQSEIYLATRYYEASIGSRLFAKFKDGVRINVLEGSSSGVPFEQRIREASRFDTENRSELLKLLESPNFSIRLCNVDYSFVVVDEKRCAFEVVNPVIPDEFSFAIESENGEMAKKFISIFKDMSRSPVKAQNSTARFDESEEELESETF